MKKMRITKRIVTVILLVVVILLGIYCYEEYGKIESPSQPEPPVKHMENTTPVEEKIDFTALTGDINRIIGNERDNYSVFVSRPSSKGEPMIINDKSRRSASMIKVFIMAYAMEQAKNGKLDLATTLTLKDSDKVAGAGIIFGWASGTQLTIEKLITLMITESDNTATNMLIDYLGMDNINAYIVGKGYHGTVLRRKMMDLGAVAAGRENYSSVSDLGRIFSQLVSHCCVNEVYDQKMIDILLQQTDTEVFPAALPEARIAHKTGELDNLYDDGGIIFAGKEPYVVVVMDDGVARGTAVSKMKQIVKAADKFFATSAK